MECDKVLLDSVNRTLRNSMGKAVIALLVVILCGSLAAPVALAAALVGGASFLSVIVLLACVTAVCMLAIGFAVLMARLCRGQRAVLGHIFSAFRDWKRMGAVAAVFAVGITAISMAAALVAVAAVVPATGLSSVPGAAGMERLLLPVLRLMPLLSAVCMAVFVAAVLFPNVFVWLVLLDNPGISVRKAFGSAFRLPRGRRIRLALFLLRCGGWWLLSACAAFAVSTAAALALPAEASGNAAMSLLSLAAAACDLVCFVGFYTAVIRVAAGVVAFYDSLVHDADGDSVCKDADSAPPAIELPSPDERSAEEGGTDG